MEAQGIEPRPSPCKGDVLPLDYASASNSYDKVLFIFLLYTSFWCVDFLIPSFLTVAAKLHQQKHDKNPSHHYITSKATASCSYI